MLPRTGWCGEGRGKAGTMIPYCTGQRRKARRGGVPQPDHTAGEQQSWDLSPGRRAQTLFFRPSQERLHFPRGAERCPFPSLHGHQGSETCSQHATAGHGGLWTQLTSACWGCWVSCWQWAGPLRLVSLSALSLPSSASCLTSGSSSSPWPGISACRVSDSLCTQ